jgi:hypothetical protein
MTRRHPMSRSASIAALVAVTFCSTPTTKAADDLIYRVTIRDFIPATCFGLTETMRSEWTDTWGGSAPSAAAATNCPFKDHIISGNLLPNLDFQATNYRAGIPLNANRNITFTDAAGNSVTPGQIEPMVKNALGPDTSQTGLLKPQYCTEDPDVRCGQPIADTRMPASAGLKYFESWYSDDRRINRRIGAKILLKDPEDDGTYLFDSEVFFNPLAHIPHVDPSETDPDNAERWDKRQLVVDQCAADLCKYENNHPYFITTQLNTFFQYRGGEVFK